MKQRTKKRCFMIIALSLAVLLILSGCGNKNSLVAGIDLTEWKEAADSGQFVDTRFWSTLGFEGGDYFEKGLAGSGRSQEFFEVLYDLQLKESQFEPKTLLPGDFSHAVEIDSLNQSVEGRRTVCYTFTFFNDFEDLVVYEGKNHYLSSWKVKNPELIKDLFIKHEMYQLRP